MENQTTVREKVMCGSAHFKNSIILALAASLAASNIAATELDRTIGLADLNPRVEASKESSTAACFEDLHTQLPELSIENCKRALTNVRLTSQESAQLRATISSLLLKKGDLHGARREILIALETSPDEPTVQTNYGNLVLREGDYQQAILAYNKVLAGAQIPALTPLITTTAQAALYLNRSIALRALGDYAEASKDYSLYMQLTGFGKTSW